MMGRFFGRKTKDKNEDENICPYCSHQNELEATVCKLCYYELGKNSREQGETVDNGAASGIFAELMSEDDDSTWKDVDAVEVKLNLDEINIEVEQYQDTSADGDEAEVISLTSSTSGPTTSETVAHEEAEEIELELSDAPSNVEKFEVNHTDISSQVAEPVRVKAGNLVMNEQQEYTESEPVSNPNALPELPEIIEDTTSNDDAEVDQEVSTPSLPEDFEIDVIEKKMTNGRIWPWPAEDDWDSRKVYLEVVAALDATKSGKLKEAEQIIDRLGPHLSEDLSMMYHIGIVLQAIGRTEVVAKMLQHAQQADPDNQHVKTAVTHLLK